MLKNIVGDWGAGLNDSDYACALAALGVLESTGTKQHSSSSDPAELVPALEKEFVLGERTPVWRDAQRVNPSTTFSSWCESVHTDAAALASAWRLCWKNISIRHPGQVHPGQMPHLAVAIDWRARADLFDFDALCAWLKHPDVGLDALVLANLREGPARVAWHWPLQVGVPAGAEHAGILADLRAAQGQKSWSEHLSRCFTVGTARDACDLLVLTPAAAEQILGQPRTYLRATFIVCLDDPPPDLARVGDHYGVLLERFQAVGGAAIGRFDQSQQLADWFNAVLRQVSHDRPIHAAVWSVGHWGFQRDPLVLGDPRALDQCRILAIAERQDRIAAALEAQRSVDLLDANLKPGREVTFGGPGGSIPTTPSIGLQSRLADALRGLMFTSESVDGLRTAEELAQHASKIDQGRAPRWIQANAWRGDAPLVTARSLAPEQWNLLAVHIGPDVHRPDAPFQDSRVDFSRGDVSVTVQLELAGATVMPLQAADIASVAPRAIALRPADMRCPSGPAEQLVRGLLGRLPVPPASKDGSTVPGLASSAILLPPAGDSTLALFAVCPQNLVTQVDGRIAIIHNNRVLQTARLSVRVDAAAERGAGLALIAEATIHARDDDLEERREYDVAIQVSDVGGKLHLAIRHDGTDTSVQLDNLAAVISAIRDALANAAKVWDYSIPILKQRVFPDCLYALAANGSALQQHLRKKCGNDIDRWERIHLLTGTNEFFPLEYVYDGPPPDSDATVCPNILGALDHGSCEHGVELSAGTDACPNRLKKSFVCPLHFWGFRKLIERSGVERSAAPGASRVLRLSPVSVPSKDAYGKVKAMLFAASNRAFMYVNNPAAQKRERAALVKALGELSGAVSEAIDWDDWRNKVKNNPNLLVLLVHTDMYRGTRSLEIGDKKFLGYQEILADLSGTAPQPRLLILLGCSTANVTEDFEPYPQRFRDAGVSIVLAPVAPIRGADVVPIAKRIAQLLAERLANLEPTAFGELLPLLRRRMLRDGHPGVMGIVGFGDGDWLLGGE